MGVRAKAYYAEPGAERLQLTMRNAVKQRSMHHSKLKEEEEEEERQEEGVGIEVL